MGSRWTPDAVLDLARAYQPGCVLAAAADWDVFTALAKESQSAAALAGRLHADVRGLTVLLDALAAMSLLHKQADCYSVPTDVARVLTEDGCESVLSMVRHQANCLRRWARLARVVQTGKPADDVASIRGAAADQQSFIGAMHTICGPVAETIVAEIGLRPFRHLLDVGGASGTWTIAWLRAFPEATATLFDLPEVIPMAARRLADAGLADRVTLVPGDFDTDELPAGADLVWLSAIAHQNSREQNRGLFAKAYRALASGGSLLVRDVVMDDTHTEPVGGAMFAVNMLVATEGGSTYSLGEYGEDLTAVGFVNPTLCRRDPWMNSVVRAEKA